MTDVLSLQVLPYDSGELDEAPGPLPTGSDPLSFFSTDEMSRTCWEPPHWP